jgi:hypothetical protein
MAFSLTELSDHSMDQFALLSPPQRSAVRAFLLHIAENDDYKFERPALAGLAPYNHDSGQLRGKRSIFGGRRAVRSGLYVAALVTTRHNPSWPLFTSDCAPPANHPSWLSPPRCENSCSPSTARSKPIDYQLENQDSY